MLLEDKRYYGLTAKETINVQSYTASYNVILAVTMLLFYGVIMDKFGRKWVIIPMACGTAISVILLPVVAPSTSLFIIVGLVMSFFVVPLTSNPLTMDYVEKESIGRCNAINAIGTLIGYIFGLMVVFQFTKNIDPFWAYVVMGIIRFTIAVMALFMVQDAPEVKFNSFRSKKKKERL